MKRIAALAALMITMLAVPATAAMASMSGSAPGSGAPGSGAPGSGAPSGGGLGYGRPGQVQVRCLLPSRFHKGHVKVTIKAKAFLARNRHGKPVRLVCPYIPAKPLPKGCQPQVLRFDMAAGSSTLTEVSGPVLAPPQEFTYDGNTYTIMSVNPGADSFTVFLNGWRFVNNGATITNGIGFMACVS